MVYKGRTKGREKGRFSSTERGRCTRNTKKKAPLKYQKTYNPAIFFKKRGSL